MFAAEGSPRRSIHAQRGRRARLIVAHLIERSPSRCFAAVALQQPAETLLAADFAQRNALIFQMAAIDFGTALRFWLAQRLVLQRLVRALALRRTPRTGRGTPA